MKKYLGRLVVATALLVGASSASGEPKQATMSNSTLTKTECKALGCKMTGNPILESWTCCCDHGCYDCKGQGEDNCKKRENTEGAFSNPSEALRPDSDANRMIRTPLPGSGASPARSMMKGTSIGMTENECRGKGGTVSPAPGPQPGTFECCISDGAGGEFCMICSSKGCDDVGWPTRAPTRDRILQRPGEAGRGGHTVRDHRGESSSSQSGGRREGGRVIRMESKPSTAPRTLSETAPDGTTRPGMVWVEEQGGTPGHWERRRAR